jgi:hypothetical protein
VKYRVDIVFPDGSSRFRGNYNRPSSVRKRLNDLVASASLADRVSVTRRSDGFVFAHRRGMVGH